MPTISSPHFKIVCNLSILYLLSPLARAALETEHQLLGRLGLLAQNGLRLAAKTLLLAIVTTLALGKDGLLGLLVLRHLELFVLVAAGTISPTGLGNVHLEPARRCCYQTAKKIYSGQNVVPSGSKG
jgi:hypothetical protein